MVMFYAVTVLCLSSTAFAQLYGRGPCPDIKTMPDFEISKIAGEWFEARRYFTVLEVGLKCMKSHIVATDHGAMILNASAITRLTGRPKSIDGVQMRVADPAEPGKLIIKGFSSNMWSNYWIVGTDYRSYLVGYTCVDLKILHFKYLWIHTRVQRPLKVVINKAIDVMAKQNLKAKWLITSKQRLCTVKQQDIDENEALQELNALYEVVD